MRILPLVLCAVASATAVNTYAATEPRVGTAATLKNEVTGTLGPARRVLKLGDGVFQNESIVTARNADAQILFNDETALTIGPDSTIVLDKFVYDPSSRKGELALRATSGAFRFISGSGPKQGYKIETPVGTIGVRGTIIEFIIRGPQLTLSLTEGGTYLCTKQGRCVELTQPGTYVVVSASQIGDTKSKKACDAGTAGGCSVGTGDDTLYIDFIGLKSIFNNTTPNSLPGNTPPGSPPPQNGFPPIETGAGTIPPGLQNRDSLPPGLANRGPSFLPPGKQK